MSTAERKPSRPTQVGAPPEPEHLPCPRCDSTNTKFCYYNNYNFSQPRHFCKSCRRYWTHGGTLRDIPVGGGTRKNAKRSRTAVSSVRAASQLLADHGGGGPCGSFTSLLNTPGTGIWALGAFGLGIDEVGFGLGSEVWPFVEGGPGSSVGGYTWQLENGECGFGGVNYSN